MVAPESPPHDVVLRRSGAIPIVGFGTWQIEGEAARRATETALEVGYRHVDTATVYGNEGEVGRALRDSGIPREQLFVTTKLPGNATDVRATLEQSLAKLATDYVDLWLIHWPPAQSYEHSTNSSVRLYEQMLVLREAGLVRALGVSNYDASEIDELAAATGEMPEVNQIPWSPFVRDRSVEDELQQRSVVLEGYSPLQTSDLSDPALVEIARSIGATPAQVVLRWHLQRGVVVIPKSVRNERIRENFDIFGFTLDDEAMRTLDDRSAQR